MTAGTLVSRADLLGALWGDAADGAEKSAATDADCLAASTFIVRNALGFEIRLNAEPSASNATAAVVVSPVNIEISDDESVVRGESCAAGDLAYVVTASEEQPIDVTASDEAAVAYPLDSAAAAAAPYAEGCDVIAHFEAHGDPSCVEEPEAATETDCTTQPSIPTFKLVVDRVLCGEIVNPLPVTK